MDEGTMVRFTRGPLGLMDDAECSGRFVEATATSGDEGIYQGPHPTLGDEGSHVVKVGDLYCPCHDAQFEPRSNG